jgi:uncharacterized protein DUF3644
MVVRRPEGALKDSEKKIVKALLAKNERNQDIQALINIGRVATINSARITEVKQNDDVVPATDDEVEYFQARQKHYDPITGLNLYSDERLIRARESMVLAVQVFNSPSLKFKTEVFSVLANIAWTYLLHEFYDRKNVPIIVDGRSLLLSQMTAREDCPLSQGMKDNLSSLKIIRDQVEHLLLRRSDLKFLSIFQANCLNFDSKICELFGEDKSLQNELSFSLQFAKLGFEQVTELHKYDVPAEIEAIDSEITRELGDERMSDLEYRFRVVYTFENATKSKAHIKFVHPGDEGADEVRNVLIKREISDHQYPHKPGVATQLIRERSGRAFSSHNHTQAWRKFDARPQSGVGQPRNTNGDYCVYHSAHRDYTYSDKWVEFVSDFIGDDQNYSELKSYRLR